MSYVYETHLHTNVSSLCGISSGREHVQFYADLGYTGIFVTDHFYGGNTRVPRTLPWEDWVRQYARAWEETAEEGAKRGLDVFFAWEETVEGDDYLVYGLDPAWLIRHPEARTWSRKEQYETINAAGGAIVQAHPFRIRGYIHTIHLNPFFVHGVEVANAGNDPFSDVYAHMYALREDLPMTAGSDNHLSIPGGGQPLYGIATEQKVTSAADFARRIRQHEQFQLICPPDRFSAEAAEPLTLPVCYIGREGEKIPAHIDWFGLGIHRAIRQRR